MAKVAIDLEPLEDRVIVLPDVEGPARRGSIIIPENAKEKPTRGVVMAVGPGRIEKGERIPTGITEGDVVLYGKYHGTPLTLDDGTEVLIIRATDVLARLS